MQKMEHILWRGIVTAITAAALFVLMYRYSYAEEISGEEVYFIHSHVAGCKKSESASCAGNHAFYYHTSEEGTYHCNNCNAQTTHKIEIDVYRCADLGNAVTWQQNGYTKCKICGTIHSEWRADPGTHPLSKETITCGLSQGEPVSSVKIIADGAWTNQGVTLTAKQTVLKNDWSDNITFSWGGESFFVTENGAYTVNAVNSAGASITASIEISCIDKNAPVILSVSGNTQGMTASGISVSVTAEDRESGLADAPYSVDGGATWTAGSSFWVEEGRAVSLRVRDKAGNTSEKIVKRGDFPYPPPAPTPPTATPDPVPQITPTPQPSDIKNDDMKKNADIQTPIDGNEDRGDGRDGGGVSQDGSLSGDSQKAKTSGNGKGEGEKSESGKTGSENEKTMANTGGSGKKPQLLILKEEVQGSNAGRGFRVVRMDKAQASGTADTSTPDEGTAAMAAYMQAVTGTWAAQSDTQDGKEAADAGAKYALTGGLSIQEDRAGEGVAQQVLSRLKERAGLIAGITLVCFGILWGCRLLWLYSVELYCYDGGNEYRRLGLLYIRKRKKELDLYLPDYMLTKTGVPRYRLVVKDRLVKRFGKMDLVVHSDEYRQRRPLEECVDFVL